MPFYPMKNKETGETETMFLTISERDKFLEDNPHYMQEVCLPQFGNPMGIGAKKLPDGYKDILRTIKQKHVRTNIDV
jgi:hypothetical protein